MDEVYIVAWTGGLEMPAFIATRTLDTARQQAKEWAKDAHDDTDTIDVLRLDLRTMILTNTD